jgi:sialic acid synthase SpsE
MKKTYIIAEIGINHNGSLDVAKKLIDISAAAGCDAVKFQK